MTDPSRTVPRHDDNDSASTQDKAARLEEIQKQIDKLTAEREKLKG